MKLKKMPVKARSVLQTLEQVKREAKRLVNIVIVGPKSDDKIKLQEVLNSGSDDGPRVFYSLDWEIDIRVLEEGIKSADAVLFWLDVTTDMKDEIQRLKDLLKVNSNYLIVIDKIDEVSDLEVRVGPVMSFLEKQKEEIIFISTARNINIEGELAQEIFEIIDDRGKGVALAANAPLFRKLATQKIIHHTSAQNGLIGVVTILPGSDMPLLTANQLRMILKIAAVYKEELTLTRLKELITVIGAGLTFRAIARQLLDFVPGIGWIVKGTVAYMGTEALGAAAQKYFEKGYSHLSGEDVQAAIRGVRGKKAGIRFKEE